MYWSRGRYSGISVIWTPLGTALRGVLISEVHTASLRWRFSQSQEFVGHIKLEFALWNGKELGNREFGCSGRQCWNKAWSKCWYVLMCTRVGVQGSHKMLLPLDTIAMVKVLNTCLYTNCEIRDDQMTQGNRKEENRKADPYSPKWRQTRSPTPANNPQFFELDSRCNVYQTAHSIQVGECQQTLSNAGIPLGKW